jgi:SAM-dependent methyltransferase
MSCDRKPSRYWSGWIGLSVEALSILAAVQQVLLRLSGWVGPTGRVVGLDNDPAHVALARVFANERALGNVEVVEAEADRTGLPASSFDLVHARAVLVNLPDPAAVLDEMVRLVKPGGHVLVQEPDPGGRICYPPSLAWTRLAEVYQTVFQRDGADLFIGRRVPTLLRQAGLVDVGVEARATSIRLAKAAVRVFPISCAACDKRSWHRVSSAKPSSTPSIDLSVPILTTPTCSFSRTSISLRGAASSHSASCARPDH